MGQKAIAFLSLAFVVVVAVAFMGIFAVLLVPITIVLGIVLWRL